MPNKNPNKYWDRAWSLVEGCAALPPKVIHGAQFDRDPESLSDEELLEPPYPGCGQGPLSRAADELRRLQDENENLRADVRNLTARAEFIAERYDDCRAECRRLQAELETVAKGGFWQRLKYLVTGQ